ncbi:MAG TPA: hypothetical protein VM577_15540 [Anaerovoracaceae bacterium]|nr:hypothetical protein [Anaerovoracaceae bacterium]
MRKKETGVLAKKRPKLQCEIDNCGVTDTALLHRHHIVERTEVGTCNDDFNLAIICANHHALVHAGRLRIIGVFPGTRPPTGRVLVYELDGKKNFDVDEAYFNHKPAGMKLIIKKE